MRILVAIVLSLAVMAGAVVLILAIGSAVAKTAGAAVAQGPVRGGMVPRVAFGLLWLLIAGVSAGLIAGGAGGM